MEWTKMMDILHDCGSQEELTVYWSDGTIIKGISEGINETCDCMSESEDNCFEYYMCLIEITEIIKISDHSSAWRPGDLLELSIMNEPEKIETEKRGIIWRKDSN